MATHQGERLKELVEKLYTGTNLDFCNDAGIANDTYLYKLYKKETLSAKLINRASKVLGIQPSDFFSDMQVVMEAQQSYGTKKVAELELSLLRQRISDLEKIVKLQEEEIARCKKQATVKK